MPNPPLNIPILHVNISDSDSLIPIFCRARLVLICVGLFLIYGMLIVAACVTTDTDYLNISGEPKFMELVEVEFHESAMKNRFLVVLACWFDSVSAELGLSSIQGSGWRYRRRTLWRCT